MLHLHIYTKTPQVCFFKIILSGNDFSSHMKVNTFTSTEQLRWENCSILTCTPQFCLLSHHLPTLLQQEVYLESFSLNRWFMWTHLVWDLMRAQPELVWLWLKQCWKQPIALNYWKCNLIQYSNNQETKTQEKKRKH